MGGENLIQQAWKAWFEYGEAIKQAFGFQGDIVAKPLIEVIDTDNENRITEFIAYVKDKTENLRKMSRKNTS